MMFDPQSGAGAIIMLVTGLFMLVLCLWQMVGLWRSCVRFTRSTGRALWSREVQIIIVLNVLAQLCCYVVE